MKKLSSVTLFTLHTCCQNRIFERVVCDSRTDRGFDRGVSGRRVRAYLFCLLLCLIMEGSSGDLEAKYNKIAAEYSKLRAQANVLKKAVVEEQSRNIALHDVLREREQNFRKTSQEIDSLTFRNQQLTKRVTVLQNELDASDTRLKKGKSKIADNHSCVDCTVTMNVLDEELQKKILENAELASRIHDEGSAHRQEVATLHAQIEKLKYELKENSKSNNTSELKCAIDGKLEMEVMSNTTVKHKGSSFLDKEQPSFQNACRPTSHVQSDSNIILHQLPVVGIVDDFTKSIDPCDKTQLPWIISKISSNMFTLITALSEYHKLIESRLKYLLSSDSPVNQKFSSYLMENSTYVQMVQLGFNELQRGGLESKDDVFQTGMQCLSDSLSSYFCYQLKLLPYQLLSLAEENDAMSSEERLVSSNAAVAYHIHCVTNSFMKLSECTKLLCFESAVQKQHSSTSPCKSSAVVSDTLMAFAKSLKGLASAFAVKFQKEQEISNLSEEVRKTNDSIVSSLLSMVEATEKICNIVSCDHLRTWKLSRLMEPTSGMQDYQNGDCTQIPFREHLLEQDEISEQIALNQKRMILLEQEKEHWHLEYQLLQLKHSKRTEDLEKQLMLFQSSSASQKTVDMNLSQEDHCQGPYTITNLVGRLDTPLIISSEVEAREQEVKNYLKNRIDSLVATCQGAENKAGAFRAESAVLRKRLDLCITSKMQCECRLSDSIKQILKLQEELQTTTHNYETQLSIMSEHLANMNEKLTLQTDEIDQLKYQLNNKASNKRKQK